jgi:chemotaxis response regulator CheB
VKETRVSPARVVERAGAAGRGYDAAPGRPRLRHSSGPAARDRRHVGGAVPFDEPHGHRAPIDGFLRSLARRRDDAVAIVLSGSGSDGALGAKAVRDAGGLVLVQDPEEAAHGSMPRAAIEAEAAHLILPVRRG